MGYERHNAIIVTGFSEERLAPARQKAEDLGLRVSGIVESNINGFVSFLIAPDGSKKGWEDAAVGETRRAEWVAWTQDPENKALYLDWVHIDYGGDGDEATIVEEHH